MPYEPLKSLFAEDKKKNEVGVLCTRDQKTQRMCSGSHRCILNVISKSLDLIKRLTLLFDEEEKDGLVRHQYGEILEAAHLGTL